MNTDISPQNEQFINDQILSGTYPDRKHVLDAAINLLRGQSLVLQQVDIARKQLDHGDSTEYDDAGLTARFEQLLQKPGFESARNRAGE